MNNSFLLGLLVAACASAPATACETPEPKTPRTDYPDGEASCSATCSHFEELGCSEVFESPEKKIPCEEVCRRTEEFEPMAHGCIQAANSCEAALECEE